MINTYLSNTDKIWQLHACIMYSVHTCISIGNHTFAVIRGKEEYSLFKNGLEPVLDEINDLLRNKLVTVNGDMVELIFYLGGDYKVNDDSLFCTFTFMYTCTCSFYY